MKPCEHRMSGRQRNGPIDKAFSILSTSCPYCGHIKPIYPERLSYQEKRWIKQWNKRVAQTWKEKRGKSNEG